MCILPGTHCDDFLDRSHSLAQRFGSDERASSFHQDDVAPTAVMLCDPIPRSHDAESGCCVQPDAGDVLGEDAGLDRPDPSRLGRCDERVEQCSSDALSTSV
jgi:hypothetical protein